MKVEVEKTSSEIAGTSQNSEKESNNIGWKRKMKYSKAIICGLSPEGSVNSFTNEESKEINPSKLDQMPLKQKLRSSKDLNLHRIMSL